MRISTFLIRPALCGIIAATAAWEARAQQQSPEPVLPAITDSLIEAGKQLFWSAGTDCVSCHGLYGRGTDRGPRLSDKQWIHGDGSYPAIVKLVTHGVPEKESKTGKEMPYRGLLHTATDRDIHALAAYVWSLSHPQ